MRPAIPSSRPDTVAILSTLVAFDTTSRLPNAPLIAWIEDYLRGLGVSYSLSRGAEDGKLNLHAILGPQTGGGLALSGHVDCVPVDGQAWSSDPFTLREEAGRLHGRGTADMKGFVSATLAAVPDILAMPLARPVHLFITFDEETNCAGARHLIADVATRGVMPDLCVVGEPSMMTPIVAHKGRLALRATFTGRAAHSSTPARGANALHAMGRAIAHIADEADRFAREGRRAEGFDPPHTTTQAGLAQGGMILNIVPEHAMLELEWRPVPGDDALAEFAKLRDTLQPLHDALHAHGPECGIAYDVTCDLPPLDLPPDSHLADIVRQVTGSNATGRVSYGTEAGIYQHAGLPTIVCGPGDIAQAHKPDEFITREQLARCDAFLNAMIRKLCVSP
ncbi:acetylornithine deacetylase [Acidomonas methanolica]|uniref:Acetylornithine deacetylase n=2 Tax=Acidomonas methanolica TaxID=437 RepID=A0A023D0N0_ACIMT|nr:acetylornithine deacetylase [Acidomonas methanolica]TCS32313.1 acetylornithine deacetylase [Acidomonas methanolica]GAJ27688.1 acetylornithine deacetylase [Acidomonas methanolica NBRC 104435]GBQ56491.1 acetylornithine deacetylase [Acidomonas methanolica]GEK97750.1 acetylornithine deacetylase [Acidomonas methanolica NBRC 104435]